MSAAQFTLEESNIFIPVQNLLVRTVQLGKAVQLGETVEMVVIESRIAVNNTDLIKLAQIIQMSQTQIVSRRIAEDGVCGVHAEWTEYSAYLNY